MTPQDPRDPRETRLIIKKVLFSTIYDTPKIPKGSQRKPESILEDTKHCIDFQLSQVVFTLSFFAFPAQVTTVVSFPHNCLATAHANGHCYRASSTSIATASTMATVCQHSVYQHRLESVQDEGHTQTQHECSEDNNNWRSAKHETYHDLYVRSGRQKCSKR